MLQPLAFIAPERRERLLSGIIRSEFSLDYKVIIRREEGYSFDYDEYKNQNDAEMMSALASSMPRDVTVNGEKVTDIRADFDENAVKKGLLVRRGKKNYKKVVL